MLGAVALIGAGLAGAPSGCAAWATDDCAEKATCAGGDDGAVASPPETDASAPAEAGAVDSSLDRAGDRAADALGADASSTTDTGVDGGRDAAIADAIARDASAVDGGSEATPGGPDGAAGGDAGSVLDAAADTGPACVPTGPERCDNGIDDDCNGKVDCADPACGAYACVPPAPAGWYGPVALAEVPTGTASPSCPAAYEGLLDANVGLDAPAALCACSCTASGQACTVSGVFHADQACSAAACASVSVPSSGACVAVPANVCGSGGSFSLGAAAVPTGGACTPHVTATVPPATWRTSARVCAYAGAMGDLGGCSGGDRCVALPSAPYGASACVYSTANPPPASCPPGFDASPPAVVYSSVSDARGCGACACAGPTGGSCSGTVDLFGDHACAGTAGAASFTLGASCLPYSGLAPTPGSAQAHTTVTAGSCAVQTQPQPSGVAAPGTPTTVCCM